MCDYFLMYLCINHTIIIFVLTKWSQMQLFCQCK